MSYTKDNKYYLVKTHSAVNNNFYHELKMLFLSQEARNKTSLTRDRALLGATVG